VTNTDKPELAALAVWQRI